MRLNASPIRVLCLTSNDPNETGVGRRCAARLEAIGAPVRLVFGETHSIVEEWRHSTHAIVVDAIHVRSGESVKVKRVSRPSSAVTAMDLYGLHHARALAEALRLGHTDGSAPDRVTLYSVPVEGDEFRDEASPAAEATLAALCEMVVLDAHLSRERLAS